jgi:hypothetical protein
MFVNFGSQRHRRATMVVKVHWMLTSHASRRRAITGVLAVVFVVVGLQPASSATGDAMTSMPSVSVAGNHLVNALGDTIRLLGVDRSGTEYECMYSSHIFDGPVTSASIAAIVNWHANAVRVPLNEDCWLGINGADQGASGAAYRQAIEQFATRLEAHGLYVILDLHWAAPGVRKAESQWPMADADHSIAFWRSVASTFKANKGVLFDLFNEPYISSWPCWLHGCVVSYDDEGTTVRYRTAGMQQLVDAVRSTGATTPLMLGGLQWASDERHWYSYEPVDPDHQLVVSFHTYNFAGCADPACWDSTIAPLARQVPVVTGEFGEDGCKDGYALAYMSWADAHGVSYLGWAWDSTGPPSRWSCSQGPSLIVSYNGTPTSYGVALKRHLAMLAGAR